MPVLQQLESDISGHQEKVQDVLDAAQVFKEAKHFMNKELQASARAVSERSVPSIFSLPVDNASHVFRETKRFISETKSERPSISSVGCCRVCQEGQYTNTMRPSRVCSGYSFTSARRGLASGDEDHLTNLKLLRMCLFTYFWP